MEFTKDLIYQENEYMNSPSHIKIVINDNDIKRIKNANKIIKENDFTNICITSNIDYKLYNTDDTEFNSSTYRNEEYIVFEDMFFIRIYEKYSHEYIEFDSILIEELKK